VENWEIAPFFEAAREVAGDFYDVFQLPGNDHVALVIGDVCDKGVGAALYMSLFRSLIRATAMYGYSDLDAVAQDRVAHAGEGEGMLLNSIQTTNRYIAITHPHSSMFASVFFGLLDPDSGALSYINAGHESPVVFRRDGTKEVLEVTGGVLGLFAAAPFSVAETRLEEGDLLFAYSDGVNEAKDPDGAQFGDQRILAMDNVQEEGAREFVDEVYAQIQAFRTTAAPSDDITMLAVKRSEQTKKSELERDS
jgi:sigma-B regulation protein RsbU (phosphoserine phosphatase)